MRHTGKASYTYIPSSASKCRTLRLSTFRKMCTKNAAVPCQTVSASALSSPSTWAVTTSCPPTPRRTAAVCAEETGAPARPPRASSTPPCPEEVRAVGRDRHTKQTPPSWLEVPRYGTSAFHDLPAHRTKLRRSSSLLGVRS